MSRILIAEDDNGIAEFIARGLESAGYSCDVTDNGPVAFGMARSGAYQLMILDLGLPNMDGTDILEQLRSLGTTLPIIVLTARTALEDRLRTLEGGANDYMPKPFQFAELLARVRLRLAESNPDMNGANSTQIHHNGMVLDLRAHRVLIDDKWRDLSRRELGLLETLMRHPPANSVPQPIAQPGVGDGFRPGSNVVDVYIRSLRKKIGADKVETVRGSGYRLK